MTAASWDYMTYHESCHPRSHDIQWLLPAEITWLLLAGIMTCNATRWNDNLPFATARFASVCTTMKCGKTPGWNLWSSSAITSWQWRPPIATRRPLAADCQTGITSCKMDKLTLNLNVTTPNLTYTLSHIYFICSIPYCWWLLEWFAVV